MFAVAVFFTYFVWILQITGGKIWYSFTHFSGDFYAPDIWLNPIESRQLSGQLLGHKRFCNYCAGVCKALIVW